MQSPFTPTLQSQTLLQRGLGSWRISPARGTCGSIHLPNHSYTHTVCRKETAVNVSSRHIPSRGRGSKVRSSISRYRFLDGTFATIAAKRKDAYVSIKAWFFKHFLPCFLCELRPPVLQCVRHMAPPISSLPLSSTFRAHSRVHPFWPPPFWALGGYVGEEGGPHKRRRVKGS